MGCFWFSERPYLKIQRHRATEKDIWNLTLASNGIMAYSYTYIPHTHTLAHTWKRVRGRDRDREVN